jgi:hypothetical protein
MIVGAPIQIRLGCSIAVLGSTSIVGPFWYRSAFGYASAAFANRNDPSSAYAKVLAVGYGRLRTNLD